MRLIDEEPRTGIRGSRVAFVHPKSTGGVLTEVVQPAEGTLTWLNCDGIDVGFQGGQVLAVRSPTRTPTTSWSRRSGTTRPSAGTRSTTDDSEILVDLSQVVYVQRESGDQKVGF